MRKIYLIRHGKPDFPGGEVHCLGLSDMPLGTLGRLQAVQLGQALAELPINRVFSSYLSRAAETAKALSDEVAILPGLEEMYAGDWDGLSFTQITAGWPELFERRGDDVSIPIPGAEALEHGQTRFAEAVKSAIEESTGDIAIVAHTTVIQSLISLVSGRKLYACAAEKPPYGSYYILGWDGELHILSGPCKAEADLNEALCLALLNTAVPEHIVRHCRAVAGEADRICRELAAAGQVLDRELTARSALLHDLARLEKKHADTGALWLRSLGYMSEAELVRQHHGLDTIAVNEAAVVFIADKCVQEDRHVKIAERFDESRRKCVDGKAIQAHRLQAEQAAAILEKINMFCGKAVIE